MRGRETTKLNCKEQTSVYILGVTLFPVCPHTYTNPETHTFRKLPSMRPSIHLFLSRALWNTISFELLCTRYYPTPTHPHEHINTHRHARRHSEIWFALSVYVQSLCDEREPNGTRVSQTVGTECVCVEEGAHKPFSAPLNTTTCCTDLKELERAACDLFNLPPLTRPGAPRFIFLTQRGNKKVSSGTN